MQVPPQLLDVLKAIRDAGGSPKFVGGTVRDHILGLPPKDFDIEVSNLQAPQLQEVLSRFGDTEVVGASFGIFKIHGFCAEADFSIPRKENKIGKGHKDFEVVLDPSLPLEERARRRDLTMNSMEMDPFSLEVADPFGGRKDMKEGRMRATDGRTFVEDDLRAVRVAQFVSRFPNMTPDTELVRLCAQADLSNLPGDRLWVEFTKMFLKGSRPDLGMAHLEKCGLLRFFPEVEATVGCQQHPVYHAEGDVFEHTKLVLKAAASMRGDDEKANLILMFSALCHDLGKPSTSVWDPVKKRITSNGHDVEGPKFAQQFLQRLNAPLWLVEPVLILVQEHLKPFEYVDQGAGPSAYRRLVRRMKGTSLQLLAKLALADAEGSVCYSEHIQTKDDVAEFLRKASDIGVANLQAPPDDVVKGRHLLARGFQPGPHVGDILRRCREVQDDTGEKDPEVILEQVLGGK